MHPLRCKAIASARLKIDANALVRSEKRVLGSFAYSDEELRRPRR